MDLNAQSERVFNTYEFATFSTSDPVCPVKEIEYRKGLTTVTATSTSAPGDLAKIGNNPIPFVTANMDT